MIRDADDYFGRCLSLLGQYHWLHDVKMTELFVWKPWLEMPQEWKDYLLSLSCEPSIRLPTSSSDKACPGTLRQFFEQCDHLSLASRNISFCSFQAETEPFRLPSVRKRRLTAKKVHEIERLVPLIKDLCEKHQCQVVVDLGCGMGYLAQILAETYNIKVLGVDCEAGHCEKAQCRAMSSDKEISQRVRYLNFKLGQSKNDAVYLEPLIRSFCEDGEGSQVPNCVLVSLHGCGDLQPLSYELFTSSVFMKAFLGIGCCYHKMTTIDDGFLYFPLSRRLKRIWTEEVPGFQPNTCSLRLASQERLEKWRRRTEAERMRHVNFVAFRALVELVHRRTGTKIEKLHRHYFRDEHVADFETFSKALRERASVGEAGTVGYEAHLSLAYQECRSDFVWIESFTVLQAALTSVIESLILVDRFLYLEEAGLLCSLKVAFDPFVSPRNVVVVAEKA